MADIGEKQKELLFELAEKSDWETGLNECPGVDAIAMTEMPEYVKENLDALVAAYIGDERNYIVEGASVICDQMSGKSVKMYYWDGKLGIKGEGGSAEIEYEMPKSGVSLPCFEVDPNEIEIRRFHAINSNQRANGLRYGVVSDRSCLRDEIEINNRTVGKDVANLISMGNCKIMKASDVMEIKKRQGMAKIYGTCYCLMKPDSQWQNPYCIESVVKNCDSHSPTCTQTSHHKPIEWTTSEGEKEGLTMLSTLLCTRGGVITIRVHGQIYLEPTLEARIKDLVDSIDGNPIDSRGKMFKLSTVEILARLIYQESRNNINGQNKVMFSVINRLFTTENIIKGTGSNNLYSVITGRNQYQSVYKDDDIAKHPNAYYPPIGDSDNKEEKEAWENAKRLAALAVIALEDYGSENKGELKDNDRKENIIESKGFTNNETYDQIIKFLEEQENKEGDPIKNEIGTSINFRGNGQENQFF